MIKLKSLISENELRKNKDNLKVAKFFIKIAWRNLSIEDRYDADAVTLFLENDEHVWRDIEKVAPQLFPNSDEPAYEFTRYVETVLENLEIQKNNRVSKKMDKNDPLYQIKHWIKGKSWETAKKLISKNDLSAWSGDVSDEDAERTFDRLYRVAMGETMYDMTDSNLPYLSSISTNQGDEYLSNFIHRYVGFDKETFPEKVTVYRGTSTPTAKIRAGDYVTLDREYARSYIRGSHGSIISDTLPTSDLRIDRPDIGTSKLVYWPDGHTIKKVDNVPTFKQFWEMWK